MKNRGFFIFVILWPFIGRAQSPYVPIPLSNCYWIFEMHKICTYENQQQPSSYAKFKIFPSGDTVAGGKKYVKLYRQLMTSTLSPNSYCNFTFPHVGDSTQYYGALRQDTLARKLYRLEMNSKESLVYDFNYKTGDSLQTSFGILNAPNNDPKRIVDSTFYQSYSDGVCRKTFRMKKYEYGTQANAMKFTESFTEGIGNVNGVLFNFKSLAGTDFVEWSYLETWFSQLYINGQAIVVSAPNNCVQDVNIAEETASPKIRLFPNPAGDVVSFDLSAGYSNLYSVQIVDLAGRVLMESDTNSINIQALATGCYLLKLSSDLNKTVVVTKFLKE